MPLPGTHGFAMDADGNVQLQQGSMKVDNNFLVGGAATVTGYFDTKDDAKVDGDLEVTGDLDVTGAVTGSNLPSVDLSALTATAEELNILDGCTASSGDLNNLLRGAVSGKKLAFGVRATAAAQEDVPTGLVTVEAAFVLMVGAPSLTHFWTRATVGNQTDAPAAGSIRINNTKPTASGNVTPIDATSPFGYVAWIAIGT